MVENFKEIAEFIVAHLLGCKFIGISDENEVFVEFEYDDIDMQNGACLKIKREFDYISKVVAVVKPSIETAKQMVDDLNNFLKEDQPKKPLLDIGEF